MTGEFKTAREAAYYILGRYYHMLARQPHKNISGAALAAVVLARAVVPLLEEQAIKVSQHSKYDEERYSKYWGQTGLDLDDVVQKRSPLPGLPALALEG